MSIAFQQKNIIGIDIGTESVGFAVTNENYEVVTAHRKRAIGTRLFHEAKTAEKRRTFRVARRRHVRRKWRIGLLQDIFYEEVSKIDCNFFARLNENDLCLDDKPLAKFGKCSLFCDKDFVDIDFYKNIRLSII